MPRYFVELAYKGTKYSGFQVQENANTIQCEVEKAFNIIQGDQVSFTGSSRTDAGVHALQNYFHFDFDKNLHSQLRYKMNAILPSEIVIKDLFEMPSHSHCRFDATSRQYEYRIYRFKDPFLADTAYYYPYKIDHQLLNAAALFLQTQSNFFAFTKSNSQVKNYKCAINKSAWSMKDQMLTYNIEANRFLRGMVRLLTATMLQVGRGRLSLPDFYSLFADENHSKCGLSVPAVGLFLRSVIFPADYFQPQSTEVL